MELRTCRCGGAQIEVPLESMGPITCGEVHCGVTTIDAPVDDVVLKKVNTALGTQRTLHGTDIDSITIDPKTGMQSDYVVLSDEELAKGFVRPVRQSYIHQKCGALTKMGLSLAETYARDPKFYNGTFCCSCRNHFPVGPNGEFVWDGTNEKVGT